MCACTNFTPCIIHPGFSVCCLRHTLLTLQHLMLQYESESLSAQNFGPPPCPSTGSIASRNWERGKMRFYESVRVLGDKGWLKAGHISRSTGWIYTCSWEVGEDETGVSRCTELHTTTCKGLDKGLLVIHSLNRYSYRYLSIYSNLSPRFISRKLVTWAMIRTQ